MMTSDHDMAPLCMRRLIDEPRRRGRARPTRVPPAIPQRSARAGERTEDAEGRYTNGCRESALAWFVRCVSVTGKTE